MKSFKKISAAVICAFMLFNMFFIADAQESLDAKMTWAEEFSGEYQNDITASPAFDNMIFEPKSEATRYLKIDNTGLLAFSYELKISGEESKIADYIDVYVKENVKEAAIFTEEDRLGSLSEIMNGKKIAEGDILPEGKAYTGYSADSQIIAVCLKMKANADNSCQNESVSFDFSLNLCEKNLELQEKFKVNFPNIDKYIYRVGNANEVKLGSLFSVLEDASVDSSRVKFEVSPIASGTNLNWIYSENSADWSQGSLKFTGTGTALISISDDNYTAPTALKLEVVDGYNVTEYSELKNRNSVLLNNIKMSSLSSYSIKNATLYGNGFTFDVTDGAIKGAYITGNYLINLDNAVLDNINIVGAVYTSYGATTTSEYNRPVVLSSGNSSVLNSCISNCVAPIRVYGGNLEVVNTTLKGGIFANMDIRNGHIVLDNVTTINQANSNDLADDGSVIVGLGIVSYYEGVLEDTTIEIKNGLKQYNNVSKAQAKEYITDSNMSSFANAMFGSDCESLRYTDENGDEWINTGILSMDASAVDGDNITAVDGYVSASPSFLGTKGYVYTKIPDSENVSETASEYVAHSQGTIAPEYSFDYTNKNYIEKTGDSNIFCYEDNGKIYISTNDGEKFSWDSSILNVTKNGISLDYTASVNGEDCTGKSIDFDTSGDYTVTYSYTDPYNYKLDSNGNLISYSVAYEKKVYINVSLVKKEIKNAEITVTETSMSGIYVVVGTLDKDYRFKMKFLEPVSVVDYDEDGNASNVDLTSNIASAEWQNNDGTTNYGAGKITLTYNDGRVLTVSLGTANFGIGSGGQTCSVKTDDGVYIITDGAKDDKIDATWNITGYTFKGNSSVTVENATTVNVTWTAEEDSSSGAGCLAEGTLITLADRSQKAIEDLSFDDELLVWDFFIGEYSAANPSLIIEDGEKAWDIISLNFDDGSDLRVIYEHGLYDIEENRYVYINADNVGEYIGHKFLKSDGKNKTVVKLTDYKITNENIGCYTVLTAKYNNCFANGILTVTPPPVEHWYDYFEIGGDMKYINVEADIEAYGLYEYGDLAEYIGYEEFVTFNGAYLKILVEKGYITFEDILEQIEAFGVGKSENTAICLNNSENSGILLLSETVEENTSVKTITSAKNKITGAGYSLDISCDGAEASENGYVLKDNEANFTLTASGTATAGYGKIIFDGVEYYTEKINNGESFNVTVKNSIGKRISFDSSWGEYAGETEKSGLTLGNLYPVMIGEIGYNSLSEAIRAVEDGDVITLLTDFEGSGIKVESGSTFTIDLSGRTYTVGEPPVGSTGTETNGFQLLKNSNITIKNGKIATNSDSIKILIQNYSNLTLTDVTLDGTGSENMKYVLSNNNGNVKLSGETSIEAPDGAVAFDVYDYASQGYTGVSVSVETTGTINGKIEVSSGNARLAVAGGSFTAPLLTAWCADGFVPTRNDNGIYSVKKMLSVENSAVTVSNLNTNATLIVASYSENKLIDVKFVSAENKTTTFEELGLNTNEAGEVRAMLWDGINSMTPLCNTATTKK